MPRSVARRRALGDERGTARTAAGDPSTRGRTTGGALDGERIAGCGPGVPIGRDAAADEAIGNTGGTPSGGIVGAAPGGGIVSGVPGAEIAAGVTGRDRRRGAQREDRRQGRPDGDRLADRDEVLADDAVGEDLDLDLGLLGVDQRHDVATMDLVAGLDEPFEDDAAFHVGTERRHPV